MATHPVIRRLSSSQFYVLHLGNHYKLRRSSEGWWPDNHPAQGVSEVIFFIAPSIIKSLWKMGLLNGNYDKPTGRGYEGLELWTNEEGRRALNDIAQETGLIYDPRTDELVLGLKYVPESAALH